MAGVRFRVHARVSPGALGVVAVVGAVLGTGWDFLHVTTHATTYSNGLGRMPFWVPIQFAVVYAVGVAGFAALGSPAPSPRSKYLAAWSALWVTGVYAATAVLHRDEFAVLGIAGAVLIVRGLTFLGALRRNPVPAVALIVLGPVVESILIAAGVFRYAEASLGNIPVWLPFLYANAVPFASSLTNAALATDRRR